MQCITILLSVICLYRFSFDFDVVRGSQFPSGFERKYRIIDYTQPPQRRRPRGRPRWDRRCCSTCGHGQTLAFRRSMLFFLLSLSYLSVLHSNRQTYCRLVLIPFRKARFMSCLNGLLAIPEALRFQAIPEGQLVRACVRDA